MQINVKDLRIFKISLAHSLLSLSYKHSSMWKSILLLFFSRNFNQGGFDMICSGRDKIETPEQVSYYFSPNTFFLWLLLTIDGNRCSLWSHSSLTAFNYWQKSPHTYICFHSISLIMLTFTWICFSLNKLKKQLWSLTWMGLLLLVVMTQTQMLASLRKTLGVVQATSALGIYSFWNESIPSISLVSELQLSVLLVHGPTH